MEVTIWNKQLNIKKQKENEQKYVHGCLECEVRMLNIAITKAIDDCIAANVLKDFLIERKSEVLEMVLYSFDKELYEEDLKQTAYEKGEQSGIQKGEQNKLISLVQKKLAKGKSTSEIAEDLEENIGTIQDIIEGL